MAEKPLDPSERIAEMYNRGIMKRSHPLGLDVYMYIDTPGEYMTAHGTPIAEEFAQAAGFPIDSLRREKIKRERMAQAKQAIEAELEVQASVREVVEEKDGFKVYSIGLGRHAVEDPAGNSLSKEPLTKEQALLLLKALTEKAGKPSA